MRSSATRACCASGIVAPDKKDKAIETIERNATSLTQIVEDVLDISRIVSGKIRLNVQPVEFPDIVRSAVDAITPAADAKGVRIETMRSIRRRRRCQGIRSACSKCCGICCRTP